MFWLPILDYMQILIHRILSYCKSFFGILNIVILLLVLYFVARILKPIPALTQATSEIEKGNLNISVKQKGNDELSVLGQSFNSMVNSLARYKSRQNELTMHLESKMMN